MAALVIQTFPDNSLHRLNPDENSMFLELSPYMLHSNKNTLHWGLLWFRVLKWQTMALMFGDIIVIKSCCCCLSLLTRYCRSSFQYIRWDQQAMVDQLHINRIPKQIPMSGRAVQWIPTGSVRPKDICMYYNSTHEMNWILLLHARP